MRILKLVVLLSTFYSSIHAQTETKKDLIWTIKKPSWSQTDEKNFQEFIKGIGKAREKRLCFTTEECIKNKIANPQFFSKNPANLRIYADCADLPYTLRAYFAWMNNLPFAYPIMVVKADPKDDKQDIRYSRGNKIYKIKLVKTGENINKVLVNLANYISSAMYRVSPLSDIEKNSAFTDFYSPVLSRNSLKPGTVVYDPNGHILVVYDVSDDGRIQMIDAHPDNSLTRQTYGDKFVRDNPKKGSGFKSWRPIKLINYTVDSNGNLIGGKLEVTPNSNINDFNLEQYYGHTEQGKLNWKKAEFIINGETFPYYEYVRRVMAKGQLKYHPVEELREMLKALCEDLRDRAHSVEASLKSGIQNRPHPTKLPENIYGTIGDWESYSTPSRDARFKAALREAKVNTQQMVEKYRSGDSSIEYEGKDLAFDLRSTYEIETNSCEINYSNSSGKMVALNLDQVFRRIFALSFDPYHCAELRWGATGKELETCKDNSNKMAWYYAQQNLRNSIDRNYDIRMDKTLEELPSSGLGTPFKEDLDLKKYLNSL